MYLTRNMLTGPIPDWIDKRDTRYEIDLSYNNFTSEAKCRETLNLFKSTWGGNYSKPVECLRACSEGTLKFVKLSAFTFHPEGDRKK
ncbi:probable leucine-rich repeat receptor-like serine/threonine-protein kinase At3g14840 [Populus alba]|uniref:probable leucine-rich repeat receptor-like serine/threonine-protein kinase At3g14840 n=1 Tax=Populus alba TaxID=43335 RepID=UPI003CC78E2A